MKDMRFKFKQWAIRNKENLPNKKHQAFLTIIEYRKDILALLKEGFKIKAIYRYLLEMEKISCSYSTFRIHVNSLVSNQLENNGSLSSNNDNSSVRNTTKINADSSKQNSLGKTDNNYQSKANKNASNLQTSIQTHTPVIAKSEPIPRFKHNSVPRSPEELF